jgi:phosphate uptake regulator
MKRKIVKHGDSTLTVSLPSKWAKVNKIMNGQYINVEVSEQGLLLTTENSHYEKLEINFSKNDNGYITRLLTNVYIFGFDELKIKFYNNEQLKLIRKTIASLLGYEIIETKKSYCIIKNIGSIDAVDYEKTIDKLLWMILAQFDNFIEDCNNKKIANFEETNNNYETILKMINLCRRLINKKFSYGPATSKYMYNFLTSLLNISRSITYSYEQAYNKEQIQLTKKENDLIKKMREFYYDLALAYKNLDVEKTKIFLEERENISNESLLILKEENPIIVHFFLDVLKELSSISNLILILTMEIKEGKLLQN